MNASKFNRIVDEHYGTVTAQNDKGLTRVEFPNYPKAAGFYDEMFSYGLKCSIETGDTVVMVQM